MSKERELLARVLAYVVAKELVVEFEMATQIEETFIEIKELLAQPDQPEPVYWENVKEALLNEIDHLTNRLAQPELSTDSLQLDEQDLREDLREGVVGYLYKQMDCHGEWATIFKADKPYIAWHDIKDIVPVYVSPPKREPLSKEQYMKCFTDTYENLNPITDFARAIEKAHGIGGGNE